MARGFKVADAYIDVHVDDDTNAGRKKIEKDALKWSNLLGLKLGKSIAGGLLSSLTKVVRVGLMAAFQITKWIVIGAAISAAVQYLGAFLYELAQVGPAAALIAPAILSMVSLIGTLKLAFSGFGKAISAGMSGDMVKFNEALKGMAPAAAAAVKEIVKLKPALTALKQAVQGSFFKDLAGTSGPIATLARLYLPLLRTHLQGIAVDLNLVVRRLIGLATQPAFIRDWVTTLTAVRAGLHSIFGAAVPFLQIMRDIGTVAAPIFAVIAAGFGGWAAHLAGVVTQLRTTGELSARIQGAVDIFRSFMGVLSAVGSVIISIFRIMSQTAGGGLVAGLAGLIQKLADFLKTAQGARVLTVFFTAIHEAAVALGPSVGVVFKAIGQVLLALAPFLPVLAGVIASTLKLLGPLLGPVANALVQALTAMLPIVPVIAQAIGTLVGAIAPLLPTLGEFITAIIQMLGPIVEQLGPPILLIVGAIRDALMPMLPIVADLLGVVANVIVAVAPTIVSLVKIFGAFAKVVGGALVAALEKILPQLIPIFNLLADAVEQILPVLAPLIAQFATTIGDMLLSVLVQLMPLLQDLIPFFTEIAVQLLPSLIPLVVELGRSFIALMPLLIPLAELLLKLALFTLPIMIPVLQMVIVLVTNFMRAVTSVTGPIASVVGGIIGLINSLIDLKGMLGLAESVWHSFQNFVTRFLRALRGEIAGWFKDIHDSFMTIVNFFRNLGGTLKGALGGASSWLVNIGQNIVTGLWHGIQSMGGWLASQLKTWVINTIPGPIARILGIGSPSKLMMKLAKWIPVGVAKGMDWGRGLVAGAAGRLAQAAQPTFGGPAPAFAGAPGAGAGGGSGPRPTHFGPYQMTVNGKVLAQFVVDTITGAPRPVAANIAATSQNGVAGSYRVRA